MSEAQSGMCAHGAKRTRTVVFITPVPCVRIEFPMWRMLIVFKCWRHECGRPTSVRERLPACRMIG